MQPAPITPRAALAAACAGAAAWCSLGTLALSDAGARATRIGLLPPLWWLAALVAAFVAVAWALRLSADRAAPLFFSAVCFLPWLPGRLPASMLLWAGPMVWLVWAAIGAAILTARSQPAAALRRARALLSDPARAPWLAFVCAAIIYNAAAWRLAPLVPGGDEPHYLIIAQSIWRDGDLRIENNHQRGDYLEYFSGSLRPDYLKRGTDGQIYSIHLPGVSAIIAPVLALGGYGLVKAFLAFVSAAATAVAWRAAWTISQQAAAAWFGWAGVALAAPFLLLSFTVYPDGPGAVLVMLAFAAAAGLDRRASRPGWWWASAGVLPALLPWFHPRFAVLAAAIGAVLAARALRDRRPARALAGFLLAPAASAVGWFGYYYAIYGQFNPSSAYGHYTQMTAGRVPTGLAGLLFDQQYGLFVYAPVLTIAAAGLAALARAHRRLAVEWAAIVVPYAVVTAMYYMWWGGFSSPARFIGSTLLVFSVPLAAAWASARHPATRSAQTIALAASAGVTVMLLAVERGQFVFNVRDTTAPWLVWASQMADLTGALPSLFRHGPLVALGEAAVWTAAMLAAWLVARIAGRAAGLKPGAAALVLLCGIGAAAMVSVSAAWRIEGVSGLRVTFGQLRALEAAGSSRGSYAVLPEAPAVTPAGPALERLRIGSESGAAVPASRWLSLPFLPAGRYRLWADLSAAGSFDAALVAGRSDGPLDVWTITSVGPGAQSVAFTLPVGVAGVRVQGDERAVRAVRAMWLQPDLEGGLTQPLIGRRAFVARRYGSVAIFGLQNVYLEPGGLWTAGGQTAEFVVQGVPGEGRARLTMRGGPEATPVQVRAGGSFSLDTELAPGEERELVIPAAADGSALVAISAGRGFRPASIDPASTDMRLLGVRLEPR